MRNRARNDEGAALLVAIVLTLLVTSLVGGFLVVLNNTTTGAMKSARSQVSMQLAEAGIEKAFAMLRVTPDYRGEAGTPLGEGVFTVDIIPKEEAGGFHVTSRAWLGADRSHPTRIDATITLSPAGPRIVAWKEAGT